MNRSTVGVLVLAGALALGACGSATTVEPATSTAASAAASATDAPAGTSSAKVGDTTSLATLSEQSAAAVKAKGTAHVTQSTGGKQIATGQIDYRESSPRMAMSMDTDGQTVDVVYTDGVMYMGGGQMSALAGGKKWIKIDPEGTDALSTMMAPTMRQLESTMGNPAEQLKGFPNAKATVESVAAGLTTYAVTISQADLRTSMDVMKQGLPGLTKDAIDQLPDGVSYTMTVDADALPLEMVVEAEGGAMKMTYSKWGEPVEITAPSASEVGTFSAS